MTSDGQLRILVVVTTWGQPSETFVRREVAAAVGAGHDVAVASLRRPMGEAPTGASIVHLGPLRSAVGLVRSAVSAPRRSVTSVLRVLRTSAPRNLGRHLAAVAVGLALVHEVRRVDLVHAHFAWLAATTADAFASVAGVPLSIFPHAFDVYEDRAVDGYLRSKLRRAAVVAAESPTMVRELERRFGCRAQVVRIGVPRCWLRAGPRPAVTGSAPSILSVGMLRPKKGHDTLLRAVARLGDGVRLTIVGEGSEREALLALAHQLGVAERVSLTGLLEPAEIRELIDRSHVFCLASRRDASGDRDGVPNVLIEAMARSVPVVSTRLSGIPDLVCESRGVLVEPDDEVGLARALAGLLNDGDRAAQIGERGWRHVCDHYVVEDNWDRLERLFREAVG